MPPDFNQLASWERTTLATGQARAVLLIPFVTASYEIDYRAPLRLGERALGRMWAGRLGRATAEIHSEIGRAEDGRLCARALQTVAFVDARTGRPSRFPAEFAAALSAPD